MAAKKRRSAFGTIETRKVDDRGRATRYRPKYKVEGYGFQIGPTVHTYGAAEEWLRREVLLLSTNEWQPVKNRKQAAQAKADATALTVEVWVKQWLDGKRTEIRESTWQSYRRVIVSRITEVDGKARSLRSIPIAELTRADVAQWWDAIRAQFPDTAPANRKAYVHLRTAMSAALERDLIVGNPVDLKAARKRAAPRQKDLPSKAKLDAIVAAIDDRYKLVAVLTLFCGLRLGEALAVKRKHLVKVGDNYLVQVRANLQRIQDDNGHSVMIEQPPKTKAGRRDVPIFAEFTEIVDAHLDEFAPAGDDQYVTVTTQGKPVMDTSLRNRMQKAREKAGITETITPHFGRNWLITYLAEHGATPAEIGHLLGQTDLKTVTEVYMKVRPDRAAAMMAKLTNLAE